MYDEITGVAFSRNKPHSVGRRRLNSVEGPLSAGISGRQDEALAGAEGADGAPWAPRDEL